jgi:hypothetical protein
MKQYIKDHFDYSVVAGILITLGDMLWLSHDIVLNGFSFTYLTIGIIFLVGNLGLYLSLRKHHKEENR